jgi:hypothetical protein
MAISTNILLKMASGHIGRQLVVKQYGNKTVLSSYPDMSNRKLSPKQIQVNKLMTKANYAAKHVIGDEKLRNAAQVRLNVPRNKLYTALIREYFQKEKEKATT